MNRNNISIYGQKVWVNKLWLSISIGLMMSMDVFLIFQNIVSNLRASIGLQVNIISKQKSFFELNMKNKLGCH